ncbi:13E12 repeat family protein [Mycolicibacterium litorale]|nr:13E12 repeat family protein [Mycolicibacterium litorale]
MSWGPPHPRLTDALKDTVESGGLGQVAGVPATIVATTTVDEPE